MRKLILLVITCLSITACVTCPTDPVGYARCQEDFNSLSNTLNNFNRNTPQQQSGYIFTPSAPIYYTR